ncbi:hypothetical protein ACVWWG_003275 [Bradyrhizobium sp. LB7.2]|jgi:hypothetical protein
MDAGRQCETNHIVVAMTALTCSRNGNQNASSGIVTARLFPRNVPMRRGQLSRYRRICKQLTPPFPGLIMHIA